jgi:hypothetical protein
MSVRSASQAGVDLLRLTRALVPRQLSTGRSHRLFVRGAESHAGLRAARPCERYVRLMAQYIAYATESGTRVPGKMSEQVISMLTAGLWGVPASAQLRSKLLPGDGLILAVGSPYREFVGDAVLGSRYRAFSPEEIAALPEGLEFDSGLTLSRARVWPTAVPIEAVWPRVSAAVTNPDALFLGAITMGDLAGGCPRLPGDHHARNSTLGLIRPAQVAGWYVPLPTGPRVGGKRRTRRG